MPPEPPSTPVLRSPTFGGAVVVCSALLIGFAALAWSAVRTKNATFDEPYHAVASWVQLWQGDFRIDPQNGPLWHDYAALATLPDALQGDFSAADFQRIPQEPLRQWPWVVRTLYRTPGNNADAFIDRQRGMMLGLSVALGALTAAWAGRLGGPIAAVVATLLFCLDPNLLAHAALVKNDIAFALVTLGTAMLSSAAGRRITILNMVGLGLLLAAGMTVKSSALVLMPISLLLMLGGAVLSGKGRGRRVWAVCWGSVLVVAVSYTGVWAVYQFRFSPTNNPDVRLDDSGLVRLATTAELILRRGNSNPTPAEAAAARPSAAIRSVQWIESHRLLPQAMCDGLLYQYQGNLLRNNFLRGRISLVGHWDYFPWVMLYKTPVATLILAGLSVVAAGVLLVGGDGPLPAWRLACATVAPVVLLGGAMVSNVNVGIRHILVIYPFIYVGIGWTAATIWARRPRLRQLGGGVFAALMLAQGVEVAMAFPDYIAFFNAAVGGPREGLKLLGDSNLDWGQDLKLLAAWQRAHPETRLYLSYFGLADPAYYGIRYTNLPGGYGEGRTPQWPSRPGVIAISASNLQGFLMQPELYEQFYNQFRAAAPAEVLGGTIYLFRFNPQALDQSR